MMSGTAHSKIGASSMYRWENCPGSVKLSEGIESVSSVYAEEGTQAHELAAHVLNTGDWPTRGITSDMADAVKVYCDAVFADWVDAGGADEGNILLIEHRFDLSSLYPGLFGTADAVIYHAKEKLLRIYDYKHGAGLAVEVKDNSQLMYYGLGALLSTALPCLTVELVIVQPRCDHPDGTIRRWRFPATDLIDFAHRVVNAATRTEDPNAPLVPGDHCRFCPASGICPALNEKALAVAKEEFSPLFSYDPVKLAQTLEALPTLEAFIKGVREFAYNEAQHGRVPPGFKLVQKRATRKWRDESEAARVLEEIASNVSADLYHMDLKSPAQIEKLLTKQQKKVLADLVIAESSGQTLAPDRDKREALKLGAKDEFEIISD